MIIEIDNYGCITFNNKNIDANKFGNIINFLNNNNIFVDSLDLRDNIIGDGNDAVDMIKLFFESNKSIKFIDMSNNKFGPNVAKAFVKILSEYRLKLELYLSKEEFSIEDIKSMEKACADSNSISETDSVTVFDSISNSDSISMLEIYFI